MNVTSDSEVIVIDANVAVWLVLPTLAAGDVDVSVRFTAWTQAGLQLVAPMHWLAECTSAVRGGVYTRTFSSVRAQQALQDLFDLKVKLLPLTPSLCLAAFDWAARLGQAKAYDAFYLALADSLGAEFWTADRRLVNAARQAGMTTAHWVGEP